MKQLTQNLKTGKMAVTEVPLPVLGKDMILVRNHYSLISAGTESRKVETARKGYLGKAKEKPEQVKQVLDSIQKEGIQTTYKKVMNKLDSLSPLGYSSAGEVIAVGDNVSRFRIGDKVACAGADIANHAEVIAVPVNLASVVPDDVSLKDAAYTTIAAIAMQGVRQSGLRLGENCLVIGLGLLGQITVQILKAAGVRVAGVDIDLEKTEMAVRSGADISFARDDGLLEESILGFSEGHGVDAVIITAATRSTDPIELAGKLCRKKGKVIIVGAVPTGFSRENYYKKELELKMATSYGPGRYDPNYETKGIDYPIGYVRWTENRNMGSFLNLLAEKKVDLSFLTTHNYKIENAPDAFEMILSNSAKYLGILIEYHQEKEIKKDVIFQTGKNQIKADKINIGFIGAGIFAQNFLLPNLKNANLISVVNQQGHSTASAANKFGFKRASGDPDSVIEDKEINTIFIATRHDLHAEYVLKAIQAGKNIFVEKPLCLSPEELDQIKKVYKPEFRLMVGYNRRFSPHIGKIKNMLSPDVPKAINYRINAGSLPPDHWTQDKDIGGGRIIGELCHFVDLVLYLTGSKPRSLSAQAMNDPLGLLDTLNVSISFYDGSIANISYFANGPRSLKKEYLEVFSGGQSMILDDFRDLHIYSKKHIRKRSSTQDKGHRKEVELFLDSIRSGISAPIKIEEIFLVSKLSFEIIESVVNRKTIIY